LCCPNLSAIYIAFTAVSGQCETWHWHSQWQCMFCGCVVPSATLKCLISHFKLFQVILETDNSHQITCKPTRLSHKFCLEKVQLTFGKLQRF
jgi:hypothetical protein